MPRNPCVRLDPRRRHPIIVTPLDAQPEPLGLTAIKAELDRRWPMTGLLDVLKEADLRIDFTQAFATAAAREATDREEVRRRLLLCLYGLGTNAGLKRLAAGGHGYSYEELLHTRRRYIDADALREATRAWSTQRWRFVTPASGAIAPRLARRTANISAHSIRTS
jgi:hypothetical protein